MSIMVPIIACCCNRIYKLTPCYEPGDTCAIYESTCGRPEPKYWTAIVSGTQPVAGCCANESPPYAVASGKWLSAPTIDGTYLLSGGSCGWGTGLLAATGSFEVSSFADCSGAATRTISGKYANLGWVVGDGDIKFAVSVTGTGISGSCVQFNTWTAIAAAGCRRIELPNLMTHCYAEFYLYPSLTWRGFTGGNVILMAGDIYQSAGATGFPGGEPIYTHTPLGDHVGGVVQLDDGVWYEVEIDTEAHESDGAVTVVDIASSCAEAYAA